MKSDSLLSPALPEAGTYTPGYRGLKLAMIGYGLLLLLAGLALIEHPLSLILLGQKTTAEATKVIVTKRGLPDLDLTNDQQVQANIAPNDYSYIFWNEFKFQDDKGRFVSVRCEVGSRLKPLYSLLDADGLPTMCTVYYSPREPDQVVFPYIVSTWFAPGVLIIVGLLGAIVGGFLYFWANKPIKLPHIADESGK
jgi:hypothetical protein